MFLAILGLIALTVMQVGVVLLMHWSNAIPRWRHLCLAGATLLGFASVADVMFTFTRMNANLANGLGAGLPFLLGQLALAEVTHHHLSPRQLAGVTAMVVGMFLLAWCTPDNATAEPDKHRFREDMERQHPRSSNCGEVSARNVLYGRNKDGGMVA